MHDALLIQSFDCYIMKLGVANYLLYLLLFNEHHQLEDVPNQLFEKHVLYELSPGPFGCISKKIDPADELHHM